MTFHAGCASRTLFPNFWPMLQRYVCWALLLGAVPWPLAAQIVSQPEQPAAQNKTLDAVQLRLAPDRQQMGLTDLLRLTLTVSAPAGVEIKLPEVPTMLGPFAVHSHRSSGPSSPSPEQRQWQREYVLTASSAGTLTIPALTIDVQTGETRQSLQSDPWPITVTTLVPADADPAAPKDIAPPVSIARTVASQWLWGGAAGLAFLLLCAAAWWGYQRRRQTRQAPLLQRPAHLLALAALAQLQQQDLIGQGHIETFYVRLSSIVRRYVELRFGLRAPEQTTEEFLHAVRSTGGLQSAPRDLLDAFLQHCDLVKFARYQPTLSNMEEALESAKTFVEQTADAQVLVTMTASGEPPL